MRQNKNDLQITTEPGSWDENAGTFSISNSANANAVRVTAVQQNAALFFGALFGKADAGVSASAIAMKSGGGARFLIDDEGIDTHVPTIENLAAPYGVTPETIELPTGQVR